MNAVGRNVFMEEAAFAHQRTVLFDFKHGIKLKCGEWAKTKFAPHMNEGLIGSLVAALLGRGTEPALTSECVY